MKEKLKYLLAYKYQLCDFEVIIFMREELSEFMNGESIKLIARFIRYGCMKFDGEDETS